MSCLASVADCAKVWSFENLKLSLNSEYSRPNESFYCVAWNHTNQVVAVCGQEPKIDLVQANNGTLLSFLPVADAPTNNDYIKAVAFSGNSRFLATSVSDTVQLWDLKKRQTKLILRGHTESVSCVVFLKNGDIVSGDTAGSIRQWNLESTNGIFASAQFSYNVQPGMDMRGASCATTCLHVSPSNPACMAAGFSDGYMCTLDSSTLQLQRRQRCHYGILTSLCFSPKNTRLVATAGADGRLLLVDTAVRSSGSDASNSSEFSAIVDLSGRRLTGVCFHEDAIHAAVSTDEGQILVYDWRNVRQPVTTVDAHPGQRINAIAFQVPKIVPGSSGSSAPSPKPPSARPVGDSSSGVQSARALELSSRSVDAREISSITMHSSSVFARRESPRPQQMPSSPAPPQLQPKLVAPPLRAPSDSGIGSIGVVRGSAPLSPVVPSSGSSGGSGRYNSTEDVHNVQIATVDATKPHRPEERFQSAAASSNSSAAEEPSARSAVSKTPTVARSQLASPQPSQVSAMRVTSAPRVFNSAQAAGSQPAESSLREPPSTRTSSASLAYSSDSRGTSSHATSAPSAAARSGSEEEAKSSAFPHPTDSSTRPAVAPVPGSVPAVPAVTREQLEEALGLLRYDIHREVQGVVREQIRQFAIAKDDMAEVVQEMSVQLADLLRTNKELREENERLRRIY